MGMTKLGSSVVMVSDAGGYADSTVKRGLEQWSMGNSGSTAETGRRRQVMSLVLLLLGCCDFVALQVNGNPRDPWVDLGTP
jgi:hypothetical protein